MRIKFTVLFSEQLCHHYSTYELTLLDLEEAEKGLSFTAIGTLDGEFVKTRGTRKRLG